MRTIRDDLQSGNLRRIYVLTGTEDYLRRVYLSRLSRALLPEDDTMNRTVFEGNKADPMEVLEAAVTLPFLAERRLIIIRDSGWLKSSCALADHLDEIPETTYFLFSEKECDKRNRLYKYAEENGHIATFEPLQEKDAAAFAANMLKRLGFAISDADAKLLADMCPSERYGCYHATNEGGYISWYDFCREIYRQYGLSTEAIPVSTAEYGLSRAARPFNSRLDRSKLVEKGFEPLPDWRDAVKRYLEEAKL